MQIRIMVKNSRTNGKADRKTSSAIDFDAKADRKTVSAVDSDTKAGQ